MKFRSVSFSRMAIVGGLMLLPGVSTAEEGGTGHYLPGSIGSFIDGAPPSETFLTRLNVIYYQGSIGAAQPLPIAGLSTLRASASVWGYGLTLLWRPPLDLGERWSYSFNMTIPYLLVDVSAVVLAGTPGVSLDQSSSTNGLGDIVLQPLLLNYNVNPDFNLNFRISAYAPSGNYKVGRLANTGKNFWTVEPTLGLMYFGQKNGIEASLFIGADFNEENNDTNYKSGTQFHLDGTFAQHFPLMGGVAGAGLSGYYYTQLTGDSGSGATFGDFKANTTGLGPVLSFISKVNDRDVIAELKWLHEVDTKHRLEGDSVLLKALMKF